MKVKFQSYIKVPSASKLELEQFRDGHIWRDIKETLETFIEEAREVSDSENDIFEIKKIQGALLLAKILHGLPDEMIEILEENQISAIEGDDDG